MAKQFGQVTATVEGVVTLNIPPTMHDKGLQRFVSKKRVKRFIKNKNNKIMATKKAAAKKAKQSHAPKRISGSEKIRNLYDMNVKKLGFTETQKLIIKKGYNRNTVVPVLWKHRIDIGEIDAPKKDKKPAVKKPAVKKAKKKSAPKKKAAVKKNKPTVKKAAVVETTPAPVVM